MPVTAPVQSSGQVESGRRKFLQDNALTTGAGLLAGLLALALQSIAGHALHPGQYAKAAAVVSFYVVLTPGNPLGRLVAWQTSYDMSRPGGTLEKSGILLRSLTVRMFLIGGLVVAISCAAAPVLSSFLHVPDSYIVVGSFAVPFVLATQPLLGNLQGHRRFVSFSALTVLVALSRMVFVIALVYGFGAFGVITGNTIGVAATFFVCLALLWKDFTAFRGRYAYGPVVPFILIGFLTTLTIGVYLSVPLILVEHYFGRVQSGQFAAVAVIGNAAFFVTGGLAAVAFPLVARRHAADRSTFGVMAASLALCLGMGLAGALVLQVFSHKIMYAFAGHAYVGGAPLLGPYAVGMAVLGCVSILINASQSVNKLWILWILVPITVIRPLLVVLFHGTLQTVVVVGNLAVTGAALALAVAYVIEEEARLRGRVGQPLAPLAGVTAPVANGAANGANGKTAADQTPVLVLPPPMPLWVAVPPPVGGDGAGAAPPPASREVLTRAFEWIDRGVRSPRRVLVGLAVAGLVVWRVWWTTMPLTAGDWNWQSRSATGTWFPWPSIWNTSVGLNGENQFLNAFRFPVYALDGLLSWLGGSWSLVEKAVYFLPFAVLLPIAGWLLAREILGNTKWTLLTPALLLGSTFFVIEANSEIPLALAEALTCLALVTFIRAMRRMSVRWGLITGLLLGVTAAVDIRPAYLGALLMVGYLLVLTVARPGWSLFRRRAGVAVVAGLTFVGSQAYWIVPLLTYHGHVSLPIPSTPDFNIITLEHGIAGVSAFWTGGYPANQVEAPLNPLFLVFPIVAMLPMLRRRPEPELVWLALAGLVAAFLAKTNTAPFGGIYDFIYKHVPGFNLFREGSKFLFVVTIAYAILIPAALRTLAHASRGLKRPSRGIVGVLTAASLVTVLGLSLWGVVAVQERKLGQTTTPVAQPAAFSEVSSMLSADHTTGSVLWVGQPVYVTGDQRSHRYVIASNSHPMDNLSGNATTTQLNRRDYFQYFCSVINQPLCYLTPQLFPYLAATANASYVVSPANVNMGLLPTGVTPSWVRQQLDGMFGRPVQLGAPGSQLLVWHIRGAPAAVGSYPAVALVGSGPWTLTDVMPALQAMDLPAIYRQSLDSGQFPSPPADLPQSIAVLPYVDGGCFSSQPRTVGVMVRSTQDAVDLSVDGSTRTLGRLAVAGRTPGWSLYGPIEAPAGTVALGAPPGVDVGPCVEWSQLTQMALGERGQTIGAVHLGANGEEVTANLAGAAGPWFELHRQYDPGWHLDNHRPTAVGDGLYNLYHVTAKPTTAHNITFKFSTLTWEWIGRVVAFLTVVAALVLIWWRRRSPDVVVDTPNPSTIDGTIGPLVAGVGVIFLGLMALASVSNWFGLPSKYPSLALLPDPYSLDIVLGSVAVGVLLLSILTRVVEHLTRVRSATVAAPSRTRRRARMAGLGLVVPLLLASCAGTNIENANQTLANARAQSAASKDVTGASLDQGRVEFQAKHPYRCVADYTAALKTFPGLASAYAGRAACYQSYDPAASIQDLDRALTISPDDASLLLAHASADRAAGDTQAAVGDYDAATAAPTSTPSDALVATDGLIAIGSLNDAAAAVHTVTSRFPSDALAQLTVADLALAQGNDALADKAMATASNLAARNSSEVVYVTSRQCGLDVVRHQYLPAVATCQSAAVLAEDSSGAFDNLAAAHAALGQLSAAIADLTSAIGAFEGNVGPNAQPAGVDGFGLANLFEARGRLFVEDHQEARAIDDYNAALGALPVGAVDLAARLKLDIKGARQD